MANAYSLNLSGGTYDLGDIVWSSAVGSSTAITVAYDSEPVAKRKGPESALEWLDRRVDELRVKL